MKRLSASILAHLLTEHIAAANYDEAPERETWEVRPMAKIERPKQEWQGSGKRRKPRIR